MFSIIDLYTCAIRNTIFTLSIGTYLLTILLLKFEIVPSLHVSTILLYVWQTV